MPRRYRHRQRAFIHKAARTGPAPLLLSSPPRAAPRTIILPPLAKEGDDDDDDDDDDPPPPPPPPPPTIMDEATMTPPRDLTEDEVSDLRGRLKSELISINSSADDEEDAEVLLDYATDMVEGGETVGKIVEELTFMEMAICDEGVAQKLGVCLTDYYIDLAGGGAKNKKSKAVPKSVPVPSKMAAPSWLKKDESEAKEASTSVPQAPKSWTEELSKKVPLLSPSSSVGEEKKNAEEGVQGPQEEEPAASQGEMKKGEEKEEEPPVLEPELPAPIKSIVNRTTSFSSSYTPSSRPPIQPSYSFSSVPSRSPSSTSSSSSNGRTKSWSAKEKPADDAGDDSPEKEPEQEGRQASLKDRLAAYKGASYTSSQRKLLDKSASDPWLKDQKMAAPRAGPLKIDEDEDENDNTDDNGAPSSVSSVSSSASTGRKSWAWKENANVNAQKDSTNKEQEHEEPEKKETQSSLRDRLTAYQGGASSRKILQDQEKTRNDAWLASKRGLLEDGKKEEDTAAKCLKERMAAFQRGVALLTSTTEEEEKAAAYEENDDDEDDAREMSLKERMAAFQGGKSPTTSSAKKEPTLSDRKSAYLPPPPPKRERNNIQKKAAVFGKAKSTKQTDHQRRMAKYSEVAPSTNNVKEKKKPPPPKLEVSKEAGSVFKDRMAKLAEKEGKELDAFVAKKKPSFRKKSTIEKKPNDQVQATLKRYSLSLSEHGNLPEDFKKVQLAEEEVLKEGLKGRLSMYQKSIGVEIEEEEEGEENKEEEKEKGEAEEEETTLEKSEGEEGTNPRPEGDLQSDVKATSGESPEGDELEGVSKDEVATAGEALPPQASQEAGDSDAVESVKGISGSPVPAKRKTPQEMQALREIRELQGFPEAMEESDDGEEEKLDEEIQKKKLEQVERTKAQLESLKSEMAKAETAFQMALLELQSFPTKTPEEPINPSSVHPMPLMEQVERSVEAELQRQERKLQEAVRAKAAMDLQRKNLKDVERTNAELSACKAQLDKSEKTYRRAVDVVNLLSSELRDKEDKLKRAEKLAKSTAAASKRGGLLGSKGNKNKKREAFEKAVEAARIEREAVEEARERVYEGRKIAGGLKLELQECRRRCEELGVDLTDRVSALSAPPTMSLPGFLARE